MQNAINRNLNKYKSRFWRHYQTSYYHMSFCSKKLITSNEKLLRLNNEYIKENEKCLWAELRVAALHSKAHRNSNRNNFF